MDGFDTSKIAQDAINQAIEEPFDTECPKCHRSFKVKMGHNVCPYCGATVDVVKD